MVFYISLKRPPTFLLVEWSTFLYSRMPFFQFPVAISHIHQQCSCNGALSRYYLDINSWPKFVVLQIRMQNLLTIEDPVDTFDTVVLFPLLVAPWSPTLPLVLHQLDTSTSSSSYTPTLPLHFRISAIGRKSSSAFEQIIVLFSMLLCFWARASIFEHITVLVGMLQFFWAHYSAFEHMRVFLSRS